jgi:hypothetical protein
MNRFRSHVLKPFEFGDAFPQNESALKASSPFYYPTGFK